jgi:pfkB family carbohydrate kinase
VGNPSQGVVAVGGLSVDAGRSTAAGSAPSADGSALRAAIGAWLVGVEAAVCAVVAPDFPRELSLDLTRAGIDLSRVRPRADAESSGEQEPAPDQLASLSPHWSVHVCGMAIKRQRALVRAAAHRASLVTMDSSHEPLMIDPEAEALLELAAQCDAFLVGRKKVGALWPGQPPREVLRFLARAGVRAAVITLGVGGSIGTREGRITWMPAYPARASLRLAGGDAYAGAFAAIHAVDRDLARSMAWASAAASVMVEAEAATDVLTEFARSAVEYRARILQAEAAGSNR